LIQKFLVIIKDFGPLDLVFLSKGDEVLEELIVVLGKRGKEFVKILN
jgi:hypothetical protein